jgi:hypothetical protein
MGKLEFELENANANAQTALSRLQSVGRADHTVHVQAHADEGLPFIARRLEGEEACAWPVSFDSP